MKTVPRNVRNPVSLTTATRQGESDSRWVRSSSPARDRRLPGTHPGEVHVVQIPSRRRWPQAVPAPRRGEPTTTGDPPDPQSSQLTLTPQQRLAAIQWSVDRYDRLRASTSTRASVLLSA